MTRQPPSEATESCPVCGRVYATTVMTWSELTEQPLCPDCLGEEESCGCTDD